MKQSNWHNSIICYVFLGMISNNIDNVSTKAILTLVMFLILISDFNTIKILRNNDTEIVVEKIQLFIMIKRIEILQKSEYFRVILIL